MEIKNNDINNNQKEMIGKNSPIRKNIINSPKSGSPLKESIRRSSVYSKLYSSIKEEISKNKSNNISLRHIEDKEIKDLCLLIDKPAKERDRKDNYDIYLFLLKTRIKDNFKSDLLYTEYNLDSLFNFINPYISGEVYNCGELVYSQGEEANNFYLILKGNIGLYKLVEIEKYLTSDDYYTYLSEKFIYFKKTVIDKSYKVNNNSNIFLDENEYTDIDLIKKMASINTEVYPLSSFDDIEDLQNIIIEIKLYIKLVENRPNREIKEMFEQFNVPLTYLDYDKLLKNDITKHNYIQKLSKKIKQREQFYMKFLGKSAEYKVKLMKYKKVENLKPYDYFGNFEMIDTKPIRADMARCESDCIILMAFNKKEYSKVINTIQKEKREEEITFLHNNYYFKNVNKFYFEAKMFIKYKINNYLKGNILINQGEKINNFIFVREGTIETSINNISLLELASKAKELQEFIIAKGKEYDVNIKDIIDTELSLNHKTNLQLELIEGILKQKQNFILSITEKGCFGEYEYFFGIPSFVTETIISKNGKVYFYDYKNFKKVNEEVHAFNEILKETSFSKLKSLLKRMITIYNSYFHFNMKQVEMKLLENEKIINNVNLTNSNSIKTETNYNYEQQQKNFSSPITLFKKKAINLLNIINTNNDYNNKDSIEKNSNLSKIREFNNLTYDIKKVKKFRKNTLSQIKVFKPKKDYISLRNKIINLKINSNKKEKTNININGLSSDNSFKDKKMLSLSKNSKSKSINILKKKNQIKHIKNIILKTETPQKKQFNVFLPPLSTIENKKKNQNHNELFKNEKLKINFHLFKHSISIANSINDASLGHRDNFYASNLNNFGLSNIENKKSNDFYKKARSINIKRAQINIIKNRSIKTKQILKKFNEENNLNDNDDIY